MSHKMYITQVTEKCPHCDQVLKKSSDAWLQVLGICLFPLWIPILIYFFAYWIIRDKLLQADLPSVGKPFKLCPYCNGRIFTGKIPYDLLSPVGQFTYNLRHILRFIYFLGGTLIICFLFGFFVCSPHEEDQAIGTAFFIVAAVLFVIIALFVFWWKTKIKDME